ncbi:SIR2 family NAD-dependent protein deacylase [Saccharomonospora halophila]|uniref:SIR2 family NAD-dependent protein deacylase n=1 Tax=Saccharomonospora halophila TaxID=129922 RepID=UPI00036CFE96|nr:Sir2 family NAD-dependent protein deacetylase [Saccharomonospora halophila]
MSGESDAAAGSGVLDPGLVADLDRAAEWIRDAEALLVCAGAGMGVDSGLPDFRGDEGFWRAYPPYARLGLRFVELADPAHFADDPELAWGFYGHRLELYRRTEPHDGFRLLREWGGRLPGGVRVFTSNVDGQFQRAGFAGVAEVHGSIHHLQCLAHCGAGIWPADDVEVDVDPDTMRARPPLPSCPECGSPARPNILMFGDGDWLADRSEPQLDQLSRWRRQHPDLVVVEIGAGTAVPTVRRHAELASAAGGALIRINLREPEIRHGRGVSLPLPALHALHEIDTRLS